MSITKARNIFDINKTRCAELIKIINDTNTDDYLRHDCEKLYVLHNARCEMIQKYLAESYTMYTNNLKDLHIYLKRLKNKNEIDVVSKYIKIFEEKLQQFE